MTNKNNDNLLRLISCAIEMDVTTTSNDKIIICDTTANSNSNNNNNRATNESNKFKNTDILRAK